MVDRTAVIWTRYGGQPKKIGSIVHTGSSVNLTYDRGAPCGVSIFHDPRQLSRVSIPFPVDAELPLPPWLASLVPPQHSPLWTYLLHRATRQKGSSDIEAGDAIGPHWTILMEGGRNGIGHLDIFEHDGLAEQWYGNLRPPKLIGESVCSRGLWDAYKKLADETATDATISAIAEEFGASPGVTGMIPKLLVAADTKWLDNERGAFINALVKTEPDKYEGLLKLEQQCYALHHGVGCAVPEHWLKTTPKGSPLLITERFDRVEGNPIPVETAYSLLRLRSQGDVRERWTNCHVLPEQRRPREIIPVLGNLLNIVASPELINRFGICPGQTKELYKRVAMALMTGNSDLHLENISFVGPKGDAKLSPVYDPAPMRAYDGHAMVLALEFGQLNVNRPGRNSTLWEKLIEAGGEAGIRRDVAVGILLECSDATRGYDDLLRAHATTIKQIVVQRSIDRLATELGAEQEFLSTSLQPASGKQRRR